MGQTAACVCCCEACYGCNPCSPERYTLRIHIARARDLPPKPEPPKKAPKLDEVKSKENDSDNEKEDSDKHEYDTKDNNDNDQKTTDNNNNNNNNNNNTDQKQDEKKDEPPPPKENVYVRVKYGNYLSRCTSRKKDDNLNPQWSEILEFDGARILENNKNKNKNNNNNNLEISIHRGNEILLKKEILYEQLPIEYNVIKEYILCQKKDAKYVSAESERNEKEARTIVEVRNLNNILNNNNNANNAANNGAGFLGLVAAAPAANNNNNNNNRRVAAPTAQEIEDAVNRELLTKKIRDTRLSLKIEFRHVNFAPQLEN